MLAIFIFGFLISATFSWVIICIYYLLKFDGFINTPYDAFVMILAVTMPLVLLWIVAGFAYNCVVVKKHSKIQSYLLSELKQNFEAYKIALARDESFKIVKLSSVVVTTMNNILAGVFVAIGTISPEDLSRLWRMVGSGDIEALARDFVKRINATDLRARALRNEALKNNLARFCERYDHLLNLIEKYDCDKIIGDSIVNSDYSRIYAIFSGISVKALLNRAEDTEDNIDILETEEDEELLKLKQLASESSDNSQEETPNKTNFIDDFDFMSHKSDLLHKFQTTEKK